MPGVVLLDEALLAFAQAQGLSLSRLDLAVAKFLSPVHPGETLSLSFRPTLKAGTWAFEIHAGHGEQMRLAASATVALGIPSTTSPEP